MLVCVAVGERYVIIGTPAVVIEAVIGAGLLEYGGGDVCPSLCGGVAAVLCGEHLAVEFDN